MRSTENSAEICWNPTNLKKLITMSGLSQEHVANAAGITLSVLRNYLKPITEPPIRKLIALADVFSVPLDYISGRCTKEECDAIEDSFKDNFMILRRKSYEEIAFIRSEKINIPNGYDAPWPYNLLDDILGVPFNHMPTEDEERGLNVCLDMLSPREKKIILAYYKDGMTLAAIGKDRYLTTERVRQILAKGIRKLRHPANLNYIRYGECGSKYRKELAERELECSKREEKIEQFLKEHELKEEFFTDVQERFNTNIAYDEAPVSPNGRVGYSEAFISLDLSVRSFNCLARADCHTVTDVMQKIRDGSIIKIRNFGPKCLEEVIEKVKKLTGLSFTDIVGQTKNEEEAS